MQKLESELGVALFDRTRNRLALNEAGTVAVEHAAAILRSVDYMESTLSDLARRQSTLRIGSCAPAPLWKLVPAIAEKDPSILVNPELLDVSQIRRGLIDGSIDLAILPEDPKLPNAVALPLMKEDLYAYLPKGHSLANSDELALADLDGQTFHLYSGIGFWRSICDQLLPNAHFIMQDDYLVFNELIKTSPLAGFITDESPLDRKGLERIAIPLTDECVHITFLLVASDKPGFRWGDLLSWLETRWALGEAFAQHRERSGKWGNLHEIGSERRNE